MEDLVLGLVFEVLDMKTASSASWTSKTKSRILRTSSSTTSRTSSSRLRAEDLVLDVEDNDLIVFISFM